MRRKLAATNSGLVIVDSLGAARNGDPESAEATIKLFNAMRSLGVPVVAIDHHAKNATDKSKPFGSVYTWNLSRRVWGVTKAQEEGANRLTIALHNHKANRGRLSRRLGFHVDYEEDEHGRPLVIRFTPCDVRDVPAFANKLGQKDQLMTVLRNGALTDAEAVNELRALGVDMTTAVVRALVSRYKDTFIRVYDDDKRQAPKIGLLSTAVSS
jgi:hypothetical protein